MNRLLSINIATWKEASHNLRSYNGYADFTIMYTHTAEEFIELLHTWGVPFEVEHVDPIRLHIRALSYYYVMQHKEYYSESNITAEIEAEYYE